MALGPVQLHRLHRLKAGPESKICLFECERNVAARAEFHCSWVNTLSAFPSFVQM